MLSTGIRGGIMAIGVAAGLGAVVPLRAQDDSSVYAALFQSLRLQERYEPRTFPRPLSPYQLDHRFPRRPARTVRERKREFRKIETAKPVAPGKPPKLADIPSNPHLALMTDPTLRPGDIVIFPGGPRVFQGQPGNRHAVSDFVPFSSAKSLTKADRRYLTALRTGVNDAWVEASDTTKVAQKTRDVETTGSLSRKAKRR